MILKNHVRIFKQTLVDGYKTRMKTSIKVRGKNSDGQSNIDKLRVTVSMILENIISFQIRAKNLTSQK